MDAIIHAATPFRSERQELMKVVHSRIYSPAIGRHMWVNSYGHFGMPLLAFPSAGGGANDWERGGMIEALAPLIEHGKVKLYCTEGFDRDTLLDDDVDGNWRIAMVRAYEDYVFNNLVPAIRFDCHSDDIRIAVSGISSGGYHAAKVALKRPDIFHWCIGLSGKYDLARLMNGFYSEDVYFNDPMAFVANYHGDHLNWVRHHAHLTLVVGQGPHEGNCLPETHRLCDLLANKGISHERDIWGHDSAHHWHWWKRQMIHHLSRRLL
jgi:esterase/lipase superfamily enzyme